MKLVACGFPQNMEFESIVVDSTRKLNQYILLVRANRSRTSFQQTLSSGFLPRSLPSQDPRL